MKTLVVGVMVSPQEESILDLLGEVMLDGAGERAFNIKAKIQESPELSLRLAEEIQQLDEEELTQVRRILTSNGSLFGLFSLEEMDFFCDYSEGESFYQGGKEVTVH